MACIFSGLLDTTAWAKGGEGSPETSSLGSSLEKSPPPSYVQTSISSGLVASVISFDPAHDLTYNPYVAFQMLVDLSWKLTPTWAITGQLSALSELTRSDSTLDRWVLGDGNISLNAPQLGKIPWVDLPIGARVAVRLPFSKAARANNHYFDITTVFQAERTFTWGLPVTLGYEVELGKLWSGSTTGGIQSRLGGNCITRIEGCDYRFIYSGVANPNGSIWHRLRVRVDLIQQLSLDFRVGAGTIFLHSLSHDNRISHRAKAPSSVRYWANSQFQVTLRPWRYLEVMMGLTTLHPQLNTAGRPMSFFWNRYTHVYGKVRLLVGSLFAIWLES